MTDLSTFKKEMRERHKGEAASNVDARTHINGNGAAPTRDGSKKPRLHIDNVNPDTTVEALRDILAGAEGFYDRGVPVRLAYDQVQQGTVAQVITPDLLVLTAHKACRPYLIKTKDDRTAEIDARLPKSLASMYLDWRGEWKLPVLNGVATTPLLHSDGSFRSAQGYDQATGMWCETMPDLINAVPECPTLEQARSALALVRYTFKTFCFADAVMVDQDGVQVVDTTTPPGRDESGFLTALLTAVCRPSLYLAPGILFRAPSMSGAGAGKGLLARCICHIAFGRQPHAVTPGADTEELDKRISAELIEGSPTLFLDNLNNMTLKSNLLASAITERPSKVRVLGKSEMVTLNASAFVILTGNGLAVSEDLARRFIEIEFDPRTEDPEAREFTTDIRSEVKARRTELLAALLTIWKWGRISGDITTGKALGSFEQWCEWVRDPLLTLGCQDPVKRIGEAKAKDSRRQMIGDLFAVWQKLHGETPVAANGLHESVKAVIDPQNKGRQYVAAVLQSHVGTRLSGFMLTRQAPVGHWGHATYALQRTSAPEDEGHRDHRGHRDSDESLDPPMTPMTPMPSGNLKEFPAEETTPNNFGSGEQTHRGHRGHREEVQPRKMRRIDL